jgi:signal transduction histidine kinase
MATQKTPPQVRISRLDIAITVLLCGLGIFLMAGNAYAPDDGQDAAPFLAIPAFLVVTLPALWRTVDPVRALGAAVVALVLHTLIFGSMVRCGAAFPLLGFLAFSAAARRDGREAQVGLGLAVLGAVIVGVGDFLGFGVAVFGAPIITLAWGIGRVAASRRRWAGELRVRNEELRTARDERARLEVASDRAQLSHDLDALLHRRLGELARLADRGEESGADGTATAVLSDIERESRATLDEMRELVGVLRSDDGGAATTPQPTLTSLEALVVRAKGADARLSVDGDPRALPAGVELSAYRVVEHLLDALEDAPGIAVYVRFAEDMLELTVGGPMRRRGEVSAAVARARERVELHRGSLRTSTHGGRAEAVAALPFLA